MGGVLLPLMERDSMAGGSESLLPKTSREGIFYASVGHNANENARFLCEVQSGEPDQLFQQVASGLVKSQDLSTPKDICCAVTLGLKSYFKIVPPFLFVAVTEDASNFPT